MEELYYGKKCSAAADCGDRNRGKALENQVGLAGIVDAVGHVEYVGVLPDLFEGVPAGDNS